MGKVIEINVPVINYISEVRDNDVSDNQDVQRYFCSSDEFVDGIGVTALTQDYMPPLILAEVPLNDDIVQKYIVDGLQRTTALLMIRFGNHKFSAKTEDSEIEYQTKVIDENGKIVRDDDGNILWEKKIFDLKGKTYDDFPNELKKRFDNYQIKIATYPNCDMKKVSKLVRKLNNHKGMNTSQRALTWLPTYARKVKNIAEEGFFKNSIEYSDTCRKNGEYLQVVCRSVMNVFHFDSYKRGAKEVCDYLEDNGSMEEFNTIQKYFQRIENACGEECKTILVKKDIPVWLAVFHKFAKTGMDDSKFADFLKELVASLHSKEINGRSYDSLDKEPGTTDKKLVNAKIDTYTALMNEYLQIKNNVYDVKTDEVDTVTNDTVIGFVQNNVNAKVDDEDISFYEDMVDDCVKIDSPVYIACKTALVAIMAYACMNDQDLSFEDWIKKYESNNSSFSHDQKVNYTYMKHDFDEFVKNVEENSKQKNAAVA